MTSHQFDTPGPIHLFTEIGKGSVKVVATPTTETTVDITGRDADLVEVQQTGDQVSIRGPRQRGIFGDHRLDVVVTLPEQSQVVVRTGSADIAASGTLAQSQLKTGSGDVRIDVTDGALVAESGSGNVRVQEARGELKAKSGSGDVVVDRAGSAALISTGSGDIRLGSAEGPVVLKTGSGDMVVGDALADVSFSSGSGDMVIASAHRGRMSATGASGDVHIGVPAGTPVWTDISTVSGQIRSNLRGVGKPEDGAPHVEIRAKVVTGDVVLTEA